MLAERGAVEGPFDGPTMAARLASGTLDPQQLVSSGSDWVVAEAVAHEFVVAPYVDPYDAAVASYSDPHVVAAVDAVRRASVAAAVPGAAIQRVDSDRYMNRAMEEANSVLGSAAVRVREWVEAVTGIVIEGSDAEGLRDGVALCELLNCYEIGLVRRVNRSRMPFKQRENISFFLSACSKRLGIMSGDLFTTSDLYEAKNMKQVWNTMEIIARALKILFPGSGNADLQEVSCADLADVSTLEKSSRLRIPSVSRTDIHGRVRSSEQPGFNLATLVEDVATEATPVVWSPGGTMDTAVSLEIPTVGAVGTVGDEGRGLEIELLAWIFAVTGCKIEGGFASVLRDGTIICDLLNAHEEAMVPCINRSRMPFKQMENIGFFLNAARNYLGLNPRCDAATLHVCIVCVYQHMIFTASHHHNHRLDMPFVAVTINARFCALPLLIRCVVPATPSFQPSLSFRSDLFSTTDLFEGKDLRQVCRGLCAVARALEIKYAASNKPVLVVSNDHHQLGASGKRPISMPRYGSSQDSVTHTPIALLAKRVSQKRPLEGNAEGGIRGDLLVAGGTAVPVGTDAHGGAGVGGGRGRGASMYGNEEESGGGEADKDWFVFDGPTDATHGPYDIGELRMQRQSGDLQSSQLVSCEGRPWVPVGDTHVDEYSGEQGGADQGAVPDDDDANNPLSFNRGDIQTDFNQWRILGEGHLLKKARGRSRFGFKSWKKRYFLLHAIGEECMAEAVSSATVVLSYFVSRERAGQFHQLVNEFSQSSSDAAAKLSLGELALDGCSVQQGLDGKHKNTIQLLFEGEVVLEMSADSYETQRSWIDALSALLINRRDRGGVSPKLDRRLSKTWRSKRRMTTTK